MSIDELLRRPSVRIGLCVLLVPALTLVITVIISPMDRNNRGVAAGLAVIILVIPFVAALAYSIPGRYVTNPKLERVDIKLGALTIGSLILLVACPLLVFLAADGQLPAPAVFIGAGIIAGIGAGGLNELSRQRFPSAWSPPTQGVVLDRLLASGGVTRGAITIRPTMLTRGIVTVFLGGFCLLMVYFDIRNQTLGPEIALFLPLALFVAFILLLTAGCDEHRVWFAWRAVQRSELVWLELTRQPGLGADYGAIRLLKGDGTFALAIPTLFFRDGDIDRLIEAIALPRREF
jgi:hypothetical protein